jgi:hypothetical protein
MSDRGVVAFGERFQCEFSSPKSDFRFAAAEVVQLSVREFAVGRFRAIRETACRQCGRGQNKHPMLSICTGPARVASKSLVCLFHSDVFPCAQDASIRNQYQTKSLTPPQCDVSDCG